MAKRRAAGRSEEDTRATRPVSADLRTLVDAIAADIAIGDFRGACSAARTWAHFPALCVDRFAISAKMTRSLDALPEGDDLRMKAATTFADLFAHFGENEIAQSFLEPYVAAPRRVLESSLSARRKLQISEHFYWLNNPSAVSIAAEILERAERDRDYQGIVDACIRLARYQSRQGTHREVVERHLNRGLDVLQRRAEAFGEDAVRWRTGLIFRLRGITYWESGRLEEAVPCLRTALWLLTASKSEIHVGDGWHTLGRALRSVGPAFQREAQECFEKSLRHYAGHDLNRARAYTDLARTQLSMNLFEKSRLSLEEALTICERRQKRFAAFLALPQWVRQKQEVLVWKSWLYQEAPAPLKNLSIASDCAQQAVTLSECVTPTARAEAHLAWGYCLLNQGRHDEAKAEFVAARGLGDELDKPILQVHASLCLADLACRLNEVECAMDHAARANQLFAKYGDFNHFLSNKSRLIDEAIETLARQQGVFCLTSRNVLADPPRGYTRLDVVEIQARKYAVDIAHIKQRSNERAAEYLGVAPNTVNNINKRHRKLQEAIKKHRAALATSTESR